MKHKRKGSKVPQKGKQVDMASWAETAYQRNERISREDRNRIPDEPLADEKKLKKTP